MEIIKNIFWDKSYPKDGNFYAHVHVLGCWSDYKKMKSLFLKHFPDAKEKDIFCGSVKKSSHVQGFVLITYNAYLPKGKYEDWNQSDKNPEYSW